MDQRQPASQVIEQLQVPVTGNARSPQICQDVCHRDVTRAGLDDHWAPYPGLGQHQMVAPLTLHHESLAFEESHKLGEVNRCDLPWRQASTYPTATNSAETGWRGSQRVCCCSKPASASTSPNVPMASHSSTNAAKASCTDCFASAIVSPKLDTSRSGHRATYRSPSRKISTRAIRSAVIAFLLSSAELSLSQGNRIKSEERMVFALKGQPESSPSNPGGFEGLLSFGPFRTPNSPSTISCDCPDPLRPSRRERRDARRVAAHSGEKAGSNVALLGAGLGCPLGHRAPGPTAGLPNSGVVRRQVLETFGRWGVPVRRPEHSAETFGRWDVPVRRPEHSAETFGRWDVPVRRPEHSAESSRVPLAAISSNWISITSSRLRLASSTEAPWDTKSSSGHLAMNQWSLRSISVVIRTSMVPSLSRRLSAYTAPRQFRNQNLTSEKQSPTSFSAPFAPSAVHALVRRPPKSAISNRQSYVPSRSSVLGAR